MITSLAALTVYTLAPALAANDTPPATAAPAVVEFQFTFVTWYPVSTTRLLLANGVMYPKFESERLPFVGLMIEGTNDTPTFVPFAGSSACGRPIATMVGIQFASCGNWKSL
jgi:hypothetical protein